MRASGLRDHHHAQCLVGAAQSFTLSAFEYPALINNIWKVGIHDFSLIIAAWCSWKHSEHGCTLFHFPDRNIFPHRLIGRQRGTHAAVRTHSQGRNRKTAWTKTTTAFHDVFQPSHVNKRYKTLPSRRIEPVGATFFLIYYTLHDVNHTIISIFIFQYYYILLMSQIIHCQKNRQLEAFFSNQLLVIQFLLNLFENAVILT